MSFGSVLKASSMSSERREMILDVLGSLSPIRVIWKWEEENVSNILQEKDQLVSLIHIRNL